MFIQKQRVTCQECRHVGDVELVVNAPLAVCIASMKAARCPKCGSSKLGLGGEISEGKPPLNSPITTRACWWKECGEVGTSSETIWSAFAGAGISRQDIPYDPDDYSRCRKLFDLIPEWRRDIAQLAELIPRYAPFVNRWDEMDRLWNLESPNGTCPKLYALMKLAEAESLRMRSTI